jgi:hypothetical protein
MRSTDGGGLVQHHIYPMQGDVLNLTCLPRIKFYLGG